MFRVEFIGSLGDNCTKRTEGGKTFFTFKVAHTDKWTAADGTEHQETAWASCVLSEARGTLIQQYLTKGRKVFVRGRARLKIYSSPKDKCMKAGIDISVDEIELVGSEPDAVPRRLFRTDTGEEVRISKLFWLPGKTLPADDSVTPPAAMVTELVDMKGNIYSVDPNGFVTQGGIPMANSSNHVE